MTQNKLGSELLAQAGLAPGLMSDEDRQAMRRRIEGIDLRIWRLKRIVLGAIALVVVCLTVLAIVRNGPHPDEGGRLVATRVAVAGFLVGFYGGIFCLLWMFLSRMVVRGLEVSSRLANMESLLANVSATLDRVAQRMEKPSAS